MLTRQRRLVVASTSEQAHVGVGEHRLQAAVPLFEQVDASAHRSAPMLRGVSRRASWASRVFPDPVGSTTTPRRPAAFHAASASLLMLVRG